MEHHDASTHGGWLAAAGILLIAALLLHPPPETETPAFLDLIAAEGDTWVVAHWLGASSFSLFAVAGLVAATSTQTGAAVRGAWGLLTVGALATMVTAVSEATVVSAAARSGDTATFAAWEAFAGGMSMGFAVIGLAVAAIAVHVARSADPSVPRWSAALAATLAFISSGAWIASTGLGFVAGAPVWLVTAILMTIWLVWYGIALVRGATSTTHKGAAHA